MSTKWADELKSRSEELWKSSKYADIKIVCGNRTFQAHKATVCPQSSFFDAAFTTPMKEKSTGKVELPADSPNVIQAVLQFMYTGDFTNDFEDMWPLMFLSRIYEAAVRLQINNLKDHVAVKFEQVVQEVIKGSITPESVAKQSVVTENLTDCFRYVYDSTKPKERGLRDSAVVSFIKDFPALKEEISLSVLNAHKDFREDVFRNTASILGELKAFRCDHCGRTIVLRGISTTPGYCCHCGKWGLKAVIS